MASPESPVRVRRTDGYRTLRVVRPSDVPASPAPPRRKRRRASPLGYALAAAAGALLVSLGVLIGNRVRLREPETRPAAVSRSAAPLVAVSSPPAAALPAPSADVVIEAETRDAPPPPAIRHPVTKPRTARPRPPAIAKTFPAEELLTPRCARVEEAVFHATGIRPDAEFMRMKISVPLDVGSDRGAVASVFFENGGDSPVLLDRLEVASAEGDLRPVAGAAVPARIPAGGLKEIYRYPLSGARGVTDRRFVVVDREGNSWGATLRLVPCGS